jgi:hypothetical protein
MATKPSKLERIHCNLCHGKTDHRLLKTAQGNTGSEAYDDGHVWWETRFDVLQCCGCGEAVLRRLYMFSEFEEPDVRYFPPRVSRHSPQWAKELPWDLMLVLDEIYHSLDANNRRLPMMGARTLLDMMIVEKVGDLGTFAAGLKALEEAGFVSSKNREILEAVLDAGSAAAHRGHAAKMENVNTTMDIVENMLHAIYVLPDAAQKLKECTPPRLPRKPKA